MRTRETGFAKLKSEIAVLLVSAWLTISHKYHCQPQPVYLYGLQASRERERDVNRSRTPLFVNDTYLDLFFNLV